MEQIHPNIILKMKSWRHHYIPQFLLKGFKNGEGLIFIYDKQQDKILNNPRPTKSVFFEKDRNKIKISEKEESSVIEDMFYKELDNQSSKVIKTYQQEDLNKLDFNSDSGNIFLVFLSSLFWRIPFTDLIVKNVLEKSKISWLDIDPEILKKDDTFSKLFRANLLNHAFKEMAKSNVKEGKMLNIHQFAKDTLVIGDNPILFRENPSSFKEFNDFDFIIALSSRRIYTSMYDNIEPFDSINAICYNIGVIEQSVRYIGCSNYDILSQSIILHKNLKNLNFEKETIEEAFKKNSKIRYLLKSHDKHNF